MDWRAVAVLLGWSASVLLVAHLAYRRGRRHGSLYAFDVELRREAARRARCGS